MKPNSIMKSSANDGIIKERSFVSFKLKSSINFNSNSVDSIIKLI